MIVSTLLSIITFLGWLYLALYHGRFWQPLIATTAIEPDEWPSIDIVVPARNEADILPRSLPSLLTQDYPGAWRILFVDDQSSDKTAEVAFRLAQSLSHNDKLEIIQLDEKPEGWVGKVAAMQVGVVESRAQYILFTDADIEHPSDSLRQLVARAVAEKLDLTSLMVKLNCRTDAEKLLVPAFVFFFAMLYPFRRVNSEKSPLAAAAGGVMLLRRRALDNAGGLAAIKSAVIDDCALAKIIKRGGGELSSTGRIDLCLSCDVKSLRVYHDVGDMWAMIARSAFTQLRYSIFLLLGTVIGMAALFLMPPFALLFGDIYGAGIGLLTILFMAWLYLPTVRYYRLPYAWSLSLPIAAIIYLLATIDSARLYWQGKGGQWKGRAAVLSASKT